ncbi:MAG: hypothetical protein H7A37_04895 [Chlamydiales bacterium]|nr:hypothetical protein [Chlamydiia bacterium]MCP5507619.1 hypothetical protein [Chlamydiales bacterium]
MATQIRIDARTAMLNSITEEMDGGIENGPFKRLWEAIFGNIAILEWSPTEKKHQFKLILDSDYKVPPTSKTTYYIPKIQEIFLNATDQKIEFPTNSRSEHTGIFGRQTILFASFDGACEFIQYRWTDQTFTYASETIRGKHSDSDNINSAIENWKNKTRVPIAVLP